ncbi:hypothetical protein F5Y17DRAFT_375348 [Xylariaceae sp. FL0594]|nr:hypothetical protein F5Y17DRAFT_375348 [Xylariaceae sp. FL0594]
MVRSILATALLLLAGSASAHFTVQYPKAIGELKEDAEDQGPCGGYSVNLTSLDASDFHVGGDAIATKSSHPQTNWLYRITTDESASGNWTQIYGIVQQSGPGDFCPKAVTVPPEYVGKKAILSIVGSGADGVLYQCSAVRFVDGPVPDTPTACKNQTGITASFTSDDALSSMVDNGGAENNNDTNPPPSPHDTDSAAPSLRVPTLGGSGAVATTGIMVVAGCLLMI